MGDENVKQKLPPGFRFCPTDEELVLQFLCLRAYHFSSESHPNYMIPDLDLSLLHPWELNGKALSSGKQYYLFTKEKENKVTANAFWKQIGQAEPVLSAANTKVGIKKNLIFSIGEPPFATETCWVMQEYHLCLSPFPLTTSFIREMIANGFYAVFERNRQSEDVMCYYSDSDDDDDDDGSEISWLDQVFLSLDDHDLQQVTDY